MHLSVLEAKATKNGELEARLQLSEQDKMAYIHEATQLRKQLQEVKAKWTELYDAVLAITERESAFEEKLNNVKAALSSKIEEANAIEEKRSKMEESLNRSIDQNRIHSTINVELDSRLIALRSDRDGLQVEIDRLQVNLQDQGHSLVFEKTYVIYHMRRKTSEEAKVGIANMDDCIA